ncbi:MAG TPA: DUF86 domain-containing protein [Burkholderiaceae bacterium]|nr:DUF86 domain-containing protein [Burkholderiaceae bacterium]
MDRDVIERKLESLRQCIARVRAKRPPTAALLAADADLQDVLVLNLSRAVQVCVDIGAHLLAPTGSAPPATMGETFTRLGEAGLIDAALAARLRAAVGFRNIAVHNYEAIDWEIVWLLAGDPLGDFEAFARQAALDLT